jgi:hypothetical protein
MAKINPSVVGRLSGKMGDKVFVLPGKSSEKPIVRKAPKRRRKKIEPALKEQYSRSGMLNKLAADLNSIVLRYCGILKSRDFYSRCLSRFRKVRTDNRFLLLYQLTGMEAHPEYPLNKLGDQSISVKEQKGKFVVDLEVKLQPWYGHYEANSYSYELLLITWVKGKDGATAMHQYSDWVKINNKKPYFEFTFKAPSRTEHWVLCLRQRLGVDDMPVEKLKGEGMQIVEVGTKNKKDMELLNEMKEKSINKSTVRSEAKVVRVKPKGFKD